VAALLSLRGLLSLTALAAAAGACPQAPAERPVKVTLVVIYASEKGDKVDDRLKCIAREVGRRYPQFKSFRFACFKKDSLKVNQKGSFRLCEKATAEVVVRKAADARNKVELAVTAPMQGEIVYSTVCGKFLPIVTRFQNANKERLILAVQVQPCNGD
jgi:hypothetical protein